MKGRSALWVSLALILVIILNSVLSGTFGHIGIDPDDEMRLVQIRDYLSGQSWFNTDQLRLGMAGGTDMHWSRLPDIPIIILTKFFDVFTTEEAALRLAFTLWPPFSALILIGAMAKAAKFWTAAEVTQTSKTYMFTLVLLAFFAFGFYRFKPGAIDHHNVQMGLVAVAMAFALDPKARFKTHFISGAAMALSVAIGVEVYIFAAALCAYVGLTWLVKGEAFGRGAQGFGVGLAFGLFSAFVSVTAPHEYGVIHCDSLSLITIISGVSGGLGLAACAQFGSDLNRPLRFAVLCGLAIVCAVLIALQAPQCFSNPLSELPEIVDRLWLGNVKEAQPLWSTRGNPWMAIPMFVGAPLLALWLHLREHLKSREWTPHVVVTFMLIGALLLTVYQMRFYPFAYVFAILPLAAWIGRSFVAGRESENDKTFARVRYIFCLVAALPFMWALPGALFAPDNMPSKQNAKSDAKLCYSDNVMRALEALPKGLIASTSNGGHQILMGTSHRSLSGNYHRNIAGISAQIELATSVPEKAYVVLQKSGVDYVHFCRTTSETLTLIAENDEGLYAGLMRDEVPDFLTPVLSDLEDGAVSIYRVD